MTWLRSAAAVGAGIAVLTLIYVAFGMTWSLVIMHGVELDADYNPTAAGKIREWINFGALVLALTALGGFVAALLAPGRRWWHGLAVGVAICAAIVLLWADGLRHGRVLVISWSAVAILIGIVVGSAIGGLLGHGLVALLHRGRARFGRSVDVPSD